MKEQETAIYNGIAFFRRPLIINDKGGVKTVYGVLYNQRKERLRLNLNKYMTYLTAIEQFLHNGGDTDKTRDIWILPDGYTFNCNTDEFKSLLSSLFKVYTKYSTIEFDEPIEYTSDEVDGCLITSYSFMERYVFPNPDKIIDTY